MSEPVGDTGARCLECDYNLTGLVGARCPECGWEIDPSLVACVREAPASSARVLLVALCGLVGGLSILVAGFGGARFLDVLGTPVGLRRGAVPGFLSATTVLCAGVYLVLCCVFLRSRRWPIVSPTPARICRMVAVLQLFSAALMAIESGGSVMGDQGRAVVVFALCSVPGWVLLFATSLGFASRKEVVRRLRARVSADERSRQASDGAPFVVDVMGTFGPGDVVVCPSDVLRDTNATVEAAIDATWREKQREAKANGRTLYNGEQGRLVAAAVRGDGRLTLTIGATDYRDFTGTNLYNGHLYETYGDAVLANPLGTSATVVTADGYLLYGRRGERVMFHRGGLHTFGGTLEREDRRADGRHDVFAAIRRELREEVQLTDEEIVALVCTGLVRDRRLFQPELLFEARVSVTRAELLSRFDADTDEEHTGWECCSDDPDSIGPFIERSEPVVPVAMAAMLLHGRGEFGAEWYENTCYVLFGNLPERRTSAIAGEHSCTRWDA